MDWTNLLHEVIYAIVVVILPILTKYAVSAMKEFADAKSKEANDARTSSLILQAEEIVSGIVVSLNQTVVETAKRAGKWNKDTAIEVKEAAIRDGSKLISDAAKLAISEVYNSFNDWLDIEIEKNVNENK